MFTVGAELHTIPGFKMLYFRFVLRLVPCFIRFMWNSQAYIFIDMVLWGKLKMDLKNIIPCLSVFNNLIQGESLPLN